MSTEQAIGMYVSSGMLNSSILRRSMHRIDKGIELFHAGFHVDSAYVADSVYTMVMRGVYYVDNGSDGG